MRNNIKNFISSLLFKAIRLILCSRSSITPKAEKSYYSLVIYKVDRLGDWVLSRAAMNTCLRRSKNKCLLIVAKSLADTARTEFPEAEIMAVDFDGEGLRMIVKNLKQLLYLASKVEADLFISLRHNVGPLREMFLASVTANKKIAWNNFTPQVKVVYPWLREEVKSNLTISKKSEDNIQLSTELRRHASVLAEACGVENAEVRPQLNNSRPVPGNIVIAPFGSSRIRDYPPAGWAVIVGNITKIQPDSQFEIWVADSQFSVGMDLAKRISEFVVANIIVKTASIFRELQNAIGDASLVLTVETVVAHIATAYNKPTIIITGGGHFGEYGPWRWSDKQRWMTNELPCFGCDWKCIYDKALCITDISPAKVAAEACALLHYKTSEQK